MQAMRVKTENIGMTEEEQLELIALSFVNIVKIDNPNDKVILEAFQEDIRTLALMDISDLSDTIKETILFLGVKTNDLINEKIKYQLELMKIQPSIVEYFNDPSEAVQLASVEARPYSVKYFNDPSEAVQMASDPNPPMPHRTINCRKKSAVPAQAVEAD